MFNKTKLLSAAIVSVVALMASPSNADTMGTPTINAKLMMKGLENPWDMAFTSGGDMFYTEKCKGLSVRTSSGKVNALVGMKDAKGYASANSDLFCSGQAGMMGVALDPNFKKNRRVYVASTSNKYHGSGCKDNYSRCDGNIIMRIEVSKDLTKVTNRTDIVKDIQYKPFESDHPFGGPGAHNGNRLRFGPEGYLWATTGDRHRGVVPQSKDLLGGNVLRIDTDGKAHPGNKPPAGFDKRMYTYGHRNVQGIDFRPSDGQAFTAEHGPWQNDEITALVNGGNGGWDPRPNVGGRGDCPDKYCGYMPNQKEGMLPAARAAFMPMSDTRFDDLMPPAWNNNGLSQGTGSAAFLKGSNWGYYEGRMAVGIMGIGFGGTPSGMRIDIVDLAKDGQSVKSVLHLPTGLSKRFRGLRLGPDGALYAACDEGEIYQITAKK
ncbi:MAG: aldose sugar dehydrogenase [Rickettsiales bacterium]|nr:aldose sugar dehydrogenase [Rickettsiales bacterium]|tara:strand:+ start:568 stop:1869 length:1302 start_codon:yes stop_codon:yes gene_type:complete